MADVTGVRFPQIPGTITGYNRYRISGETYPGLVAEEGGRVDGIVYKNISAAAWVQLDCFEGLMEQRDNCIYEAVHRAWSKCRSTHREAAAKPTVRCVAAR